MATRTWTGATSGDWTITGNWAEGAVPVNGDDVFLSGTSAAVTAGLAQSAVTLNTLNIDSSFTGQLGTATAYLQIGATLTTIAAGNSTGATRLKIDYGSAANTTVVAATSTSSADVAKGLPPVQLLGSSVTLVLTGGSVSVAASSGETATLAAVNLSRGGNGPDPALLLGPGCTVTALDVAAGTAINKSNQTCPLVGVSGGVYDFRGGGAHTALSVDKGTVLYSGTGTITTVSVGGTLDFSRDPRPKTVTTCNLYRGATLNADNGNPQSITFTNGITLLHCEIEDIALIRVGSNIVLAVSGA